MYVIVFKIVFSFLLQVSVSQQESLVLLKASHAGNIDKLVRSLIRLMIRLFLYDVWGDISALREKFPKGQLLQLQIIMSTC